MNRQTSLRNSIALIHPCFLASLAVFIVFFLPVQASENLVFDGFDWNNFLPIMKIAYVSGLYDGSAFCETAVLDSQNIDASPTRQRFPLDMTFKEVVLALDAFYGNPDNLPLPIVYAIYLIKLTRDGLDPNALQKYRDSLFQTLQLPVS